MLAVVRFIDQVTAADGIAHGDAVLRIPEIDAIEERAFDIVLEEQLPRSAAVACAIDAAVFSSTEHDCCVCIERGDVSEIQTVGVRDAHYFKRLAAINGTNDRSRRATSPNDRAAYDSDTTHARVRAAGQRVHHSELGQLLPS